jgi:hypothetical protein
MPPTLTGKKQSEAAASLGAGDVVKVLLGDSRVDPTAVDNEAIQQAANLAVLEHLLADARVDPTADKCRVLTRCCQFGLRRCALACCRTSALFRASRTSRTRRAAAMARSWRCFC